jgi:hypothetical protein
LLSHAALLPLAIHADVERDRIIKGRDRSRWRFTSNKNCDHDAQLPPHLPSVASTPLKGNSSDVEKAL